MGRGCVALAKLAAVSTKLSHSAGRECLYVSGQQPLTGLGWYGVAVLSMWAFFQGHSPLTISWLEEEAAVIQDHSFPKSLIGEDPTWGGIQKHTDTPSSFDLLIHTLLSETVALIAVLSGTASQAHWEESAILAGDTEDITCTTQVASEGATFPWVSYPSPRSQVFSKLNSNDRRSESVLSTTFV